ncbi:hypothetical protein T484DRAFT_1853117 [Baffinella frigidus]|nr:hypothetical protein T484DRAFT_1853117 [Cryptophyta sp. CCMP2293]
MSGYTAGGWAFTISPTPNLEVLTRKGLYRRGVALRNLDRIPEAIDQFEKAFLERPEDETVRKELAKCLGSTTVYFDRVDTLTAQLSPEKAARLKMAGKREKEVRLNL